MKVNAQYNVAAPDSMPIRLAAHQRRKMFAHFLQATGIKSSESLLDIGATSDRSYDHSNYVPAWYPHKSRVTAVGLDDAHFLERLYPGLTFVRADGRSLPFSDGAFDYVHSSAVLEHVGDQQSQIRFVQESWRVARRGLFLTTPNRWFPIEFHTVLPLIHWLPKSAFRRVLRMIQKDFFAEEKNLNLLTARELAGIADVAGLRDFRVESVALLGWPTNLLLIASKAPQGI